jgi:hypothetical protein
VRQSKHETDRAEIEKAKKHFRKWKTKELLEHYVVSERVLYKHARLAIEQVLAERGIPKARIFEVSKA